MAIGKRPYRRRIAGTARRIGLLAAALGVLANPLYGQDGKICSDDSEACALLRTWYKEGTASGNHGDFYDNRDRGHALVKFDGQQIQTVRYSEADRKAGRDYSGPRRVRPHITVGNASLAAPVHKGGSIPRLFYLAEHRGIEFLHSLYRHNNLYIFPEHRDHDPGRGGIGGHGDLFSLNTPYIVITQGSSGSDMPFVRAFVKTLAALRPAVKQELARAGMLVPTLQMIMRWSNKGIQSDKAYLSGAAHPTAFEGKRLDIEQMVRFAHEIGVGALPPLVQLEVVEEEIARNGRDFFARPGQDEVLSDTPGVVARIFRRIHGPMRLTISAKGSVDPNGRPLHFEWVVLNGDPGSVRIDPRDGGREALIEADYHGWGRRGANGVDSGRIDIGVFAYNGIYYSAPAFVSLASPGNEDRLYDEAGRPLLVQYEAGQANLHLQAKDYKYWDRIFAFFEAKEKPLEGRLLEARLGIEKVRLLRGLADKSALLRLEYARLRTVGDSLTAASRQIKKSLKEAQERSDEEEGARLKKKTQAVGERIAHLNKVEFAPVERSLAALFNEPLTPQEETPRQMLLAAFEAIADDPTLYPLHVEEIHRRVRSVGDTKKKGRDRLWELRMQLVEEGILHEVPGNRLMLDSRKVRQGLGASARYGFRLLNLTLMAYFLYPDTVLPQNKPNYIDTRQVARKRWRDLYRYGAAGEYLGWTRFLGKGRKAQEYTPDGLLVVERTPEGTPFKGRLVRYIVGEDGYLRPEPAGPVVSLP